MTQSTPIDLSAYFSALADGHLGLAGILRIEAIDMLAERFHVRRSEASALLDLVVDEQRTW